MFSRFNEKKTLLGYTTGLENVMSSTFAQVRAGERGDSSGDLYDRGIESQSLDYYCRLKIQRNNS